MSRVRCKEAAAIGSEHFDRFLRSNRSLGDHLPCALEGVGDRIGFQVLDYALRAEKNRGHQREREQHVEHGPHKIHPEIADGVCPLANEAAHQGDRSGQARASRDKILHCQRGHLDQVTQRGFPAVGLPVGVGHEADRGIEGQIGGDGSRLRRGAR